MVQTTPASPSPGGQKRYGGGGQLLQELEALSQSLYQAGQRNDGSAIPPSPNKVLARRETMPARPVSEVHTQSESAIPLATLLRSSFPRPPVQGKSTSSFAADAGRKAESFRMEPSRAGSESPGRLQHWGSLPEATNLSEWMQDSVDISQKLEAPVEKKKGLWGWKPFRALAHIGQQKYNCLFTVHVHGIEGLPASMNGLRLAVSFARKDETGVQTLPSRVFQGHAEFQETLNVRCSLHSSKNGVKGLKWESKQFTLLVVALDVDELVLGRHKLELSRLLPESLEDDEEKQDTWTTSFKLTGKAQGATLVVTFGCEIQSKDFQNLSATSSSRIGESPVLRARSFNSLPNSGFGTPQKRNSNANYSPAMSDPLVEYHSMEHLSLDDSLYSPVKGEIRPVFQNYPGEDAKLRMCTQTDSMLAPATPVQSVEGLIEGTKNHRHECVNGGEEEEEEDDDDLEFTVVDQGVEVSTILDTGSSQGYTDLEGEDDSAVENEQLAGSVDVSTQDEEEVEDGSGFEEEQVTGSINASPPGEEEIEYGSALEEEQGASTDVSTQDEEEVEVGLPLDEERVTESTNVFTQYYEEVEDGSISDEEQVGRSTTVSTQHEEVEAGSPSEEEQVGRSSNVSTHDEEEADNMPAQPESCSGDGDSLLDEGEVVTEELMETHMKDNEEALKADGEVSDKEEELEKQITEYQNVKTQSTNSYDIPGMKEIPTLVEPQNLEESSRSSMDEDLEMEELLAALGEERYDFEGEEAVESSQQYRNMQEEDLRAGGQGHLGSHKDGNITCIDEETEKHVLDLPDDITEEELLLLLPGEVDMDWMSGKGVTQSKVPESDDEFDPVAGEFLDLLETQSGPLQVALTSDSEPDSPRAVLLKQFEHEALVESGLGLDMRLPEALFMQHSEVPDFDLDGMSSDPSFDDHTMDDSHKLPVHRFTLSEDISNLGWGSEEDFEIASIMEAAESELQKATQTMRSRTKAKMLEDEETEALMQEWGLNQKVFEASPPKPSYLDDTGNPYAMVVADAPPLGQSLGPVVQTRDGGSLRSMSPSNFQLTSGGQLVMQVSKPVVVPTDMGATSMDILRRMAAAGMEGMADQSMMAMPLDDITGKSVEQIASEGFATLEGRYTGRNEHGYAGLEGGQTALSLEYGQEDHKGVRALASRGASGLTTSYNGHANRRNSKSNLKDDTFLSLEDLAPMAMQKIEALALEGLQVQSDMAEEEAPYMVDPLSWQEMPALEGGPTTRWKGGKTGGSGSLEGVTTMRLLEGGNTEDSDDSLSMAISLDEWMRLDAGVADENETSDNSMALLTTHHTTHGHIVPGKQNRVKEGEKHGADATNLKGGFMGDTLTLAMLVQLRDPLRNYEPVGAPMMALVQAERVMVPPTPRVRLGRRISLKGNSEDADEDSDTPAQPQFKITEVTMSGLKTGEESAPASKKQIGWGSQKQQQSGSRWLVANGMSKTTKHPMLQSKAMGVSPAPATAAAAAAGSKPASSTTKTDSLWSISSKAGSKWGSQAGAKTRNPDVVMAKTGWFGRKK